MDAELKSANSVKTGKNFSAKRLELGYSIDDVCKKVFVNKDYLIAIEEGNYSIFPSESFAKAYFNKYQKFLEIEQEFPLVFDQKPEKRHKKISAEISFNNNFDNYVKYTIVALVLLISIFLGIYISADRVSTQQIDSPNKIIKAEDILSITNIIDKRKKELNQVPQIIKNNNLILYFEDECWLELYVENELIETKLFNNGEEYTKVIESPFRIIVGNGDSVKGTYNGIEIDFISNANRLTKVNIINF